MHDDMDGSIDARAARHVVAACYLGWTLDAFDFFIMVFLFADVAAAFGTTLTVVAWAVTATLAARPFGALLFGALAERYGRRPVLMASVLGYSAFELASGFTPNLGGFIALRALFGMAMGGEWGIGAALTMESTPSHWRGAVSGILQAGYPSGYLLATLLYWMAYPLVGWRGMFVLGALPALLVLYIRRSVPESAAWRESRARAPASSLFPASLRPAWKLLAQAVLMMAAFNFLSHGTQDLYPTFLKTQRGFDHGTVAAIALLYNLGAMLGGVMFGMLSQRLGRRAGIVLACLGALLAIQPWAFATAPVSLAIGAFAMQFCVQGAWGIVPAHLNEISPPGLRAVFPGAAYQLGNLLAAGNAPMQAALAQAAGNGGHDYRWPLAGTVAVVAVALAAVAGLGPEARTGSLRRAS